MNDIYSNPDWQKLLLDLRFHFGFATKIAPLVGLTTDRIRFILCYGTDNILWVHGNAIIQLHKQYGTRNKMNNGKHSQAFRDSEFEAVKNVLIRPMHRYDIEKLVPIKSLYSKMNKWVVEGKMFSAKMHVGNKIYQFYSLTPLHDDIKPVLQHFHRVEQEKKPKPQRIVRVGDRLIHSCL